MPTLIRSIFMCACNNSLAAELGKKKKDTDFGDVMLLTVIFPLKPTLQKKNVRVRIKAAIGEYDEPLTMVKRRKLR